MLKYSKQTINSDQSLTSCQAPLYRESANKKLIISFCDQGKISVSSMTMNDVSPVITSSEVLTVPSDATVTPAEIPTCFDAALSDFDKDSLYISCKNKPATPSVNLIKEDILQVVQNTIRLFRYDLNTK